MPATSLKQKHLMDAVAHNPAFAKKVGIPQSVGADFSEASKGMTFGSGRASTQGVNKPKTDHGAAAPFKRGGLMKSEKSMGMAKKLAMSSRNGETAEMAMKKGGKTVKKMASGGITTAKMGKAEVGGKLKHGEHTIQKKGHTRALEEKMSAGKPLGMKHGGKTHHKR